ncbi:AAA family ATPase [Schaalia sp. 19OD2882]|uniref:AAA family ATPase n=1 Tax=Schaalia sp. 19OD2882 TaxID=2794089 RepID=UPI001C1E9855|nr:AAA family ATPase [Schaalia sp. 19OD2882]QWW20317.1 AAA family ATPase [Schaalia sp. 19OD2882]
MRPRTLDFTGIGPFAGPQHIDFTEFEASGIFLLRGPTGAGKSTLVDAVTFALFGDVARQGDSDKARLRSTYCRSLDPSVVELVFETGRGLFRVRRTPSYTKAGRKTPLNATIRLERVVEGDDGAFTQVEAISSNIQEANAELSRIVGLTKEQFLQTVVLPQGKFARFLSATSAERERILRNVFGTHVFQVVQDELRGRAGDAQSRISAARTQLATAIGIFAGLVASSAAHADAAQADVGIRAEPAHPLQDAAGASLMDSHALRALCEAELEVLDGAREAASERMGPLQARAHACQEALERARTLEALIARRDQLLERLETLNADAPRVAADRSRLEAAARADEVWHLVEAARTCAQDLDAARLKALAHVNALDRSTGVQVPAGSDAQDFPADLLAQVTAAHQGQHTRRTLLDSLRDVEQALQDKEALIARTSASIDSDQASLVEVEGTLAEAPARRRALDDEIAALETLTAQAPALQEQVHALDERIEAANRADLLRAGLAGLSQDLGTATQEARVARAHSFVLHEAWLADSALTLAADLHQGQACPVCGSCEHPSPARPGPDPTHESVSRADLDRADEALRAAEEKVSTARTAHTRAVETIAELNARAKGDSTSLALAKKDLSAQVDRVAAAGRRLAEARNDLAAVHTQVTTASALSADLREKLASARTALEAARAGAEEDRRQLRAVLPDGASAAQTLARAEAELAALADTQEALRSWEKATDMLSDMRGRCLAALAEAGFPAGDEGVRAVREAHLLRAESEALAAAIRAHDGALASVQEQLASDPIRSCEGAEAPDIDSLAVAETAAREALAAASAEVLARTTALQEASRALDSLTAAAEVRDRAASEAGAVCRLSALANATGPENLLQTPLASWVLMSRFQEVLDAANPRLLDISSGRYELEKVLDDGTQSRKSGLGLRVRDHDTDEVRATRTLSGGETFYTSLALALGLSDVVTAEAGGIEMGTLFIDEGFGSLDAATLDVVMGQLEALREGGRTVGVISHVDELARRIPEQVIVSWEPSRGSTVTLRR